MEIGTSDTLPGRRFRQDSGPLYGQVASLMRRRIESGEWKAGCRIPSLDELVRSLKVARVTIRQAVGLLETEGLLEAQQGRGTFVSTDLPKRRWLRLAAEWRDLLDDVQELSPRALVVENAERLPRLSPEEGAPAPAYQYMRRVHSRDGQPYCLIDVYLDKRVYNRASKAFRTKIVLPLLETVGRVRIGRAHQTLMIGSADVDTARHLNLRVNAPIAEVRRVISDRGGVVVYCADLVYRGDAVRLDITLLNAMET